jgi:hypothetical protein
MKTNETQKKKEQRRAEFSKRLDLDAARKRLHQATMEIQYGLVHHSKADMLYALAWEMGHSSGFSEVENYYRDMAPLLK